MSWMDDLTGPSKNFPYPKGLDALPDFDDIEEGGKERSVIRGRIAIKDVRAGKNGDSFVFNVMFQGHEIGDDYAGMAEKAYWVNPDELDKAKTKKGVAFVALYAINNGLIEPEELASPNLTIEQVQALHTAISKGNTKPMTFGGAIYWERGKFTDKDDREVEYDTDGVWLDKKPDFQPMETPF